MEKRIIVKNMLSAKYALQLEKAQTLFAFSSSHTNEVASIAAVDGEAEQFSN